MANLALRHLTKSHGKSEVLHDITLDVADGEFVVFVGPSGCGKSTTLRIIAGFEETTTGIIETGGREVNNLEPKDRDIAMVFQNYAIYPHMSVKKNIAFGRGLPRCQRHIKNYEYKRLRVFLIWLTCLIANPTRCHAVNASVTAGADILLGVRPDDLYTGSSTPIMIGTITVREPLGSKTLIYVDTPSGEIIAKADGRHPPDVGETVQPSADPENLHVFDAATGEALK